MNLSQLIEAAATAAGGKKLLAAEMQKQPARVSEWLSGERKPDAHELAFMAARAGLPVLETVAEVEAELDPRYSSIWRAALGKLRAAGVAAGASGAVVLSAALTGGQMPEKASASTAYAHDNCGSSTAPRYTLPQVRPTPAKPAAVVNRDGRPMFGKSLPHPRNDRSDETMLVRSLNLEGSR